MTAPRPPLFDAHPHIIDARFLLVPNDGYLPEPFTVADYRARTAHLRVASGAVVSGSFQALRSESDQGYPRSHPVLGGAARRPARTDQLHERGEEPHPSWLAPLPVGALHPPQ